MQTVIYDPRAGVGAFELELRDARRRRKERMQAAAAKEPAAPHIWFFIISETRVDGPLRVEQIQRAVAKHYGVKMNDLLSARRTADIVRPRQVAMYLAKTMTRRSLPEIGRRFGGRDHTTVLHAVRKIGSLVKVNTDLCEDVTALEQKLRVPEGQA